MYLTDSQSNVPHEPFDQLQLADLVLEIDHTGKIYYSSESLPDNAIANIFKLIDPLETEVLKAKITDVIERAQNTTLEIGLLWKDEFKWFVGILVPLQKAPDRFHLLLRNATHNLYNRLALKNLLDSSHEGYIFLKSHHPSQPFWFEKSEDFWDTPFAEQEISEMNTAFVEMWGWFPKEGEEFHLADLLADDEWLSRQMWQKLLKQGTVEGERLIEHPRSTRHLRYEFHSMYDQLGRFIGHFGVWHDITLQRSTEKHNHLLATLVESSQVAIFSIDTSYRITTWNRGALLMYGYSEMEAKKMSIWDLFALEASQLRRLWEETKRLQQAEVKHIKRTGDLMDVSMNASVILDSKNSLQTGWAIVCNNISQQKRLEKELTEAKLEADRANRAKSLFLANMSHELRTPLNAIIGYSELLLEESEQLAARARLDITNIGKAGAHLLQMINRTLDLVKIESGKMEIDVEEINWKELIDPLQASIAPLAQKNQNLFLLDLPSVFPDFYSDCTRLRQILLNLLANACKYTECGQVRLTIEPLESGIHFVVADTGSGIPADRIHRIFGEFEQANRDDSKRYGGTGLGLSLSKNLAQLLGGDISVESELGKGSVFHMHLPNLIHRVGKDF